MKTSRRAAIVGLVATASLVGGIGIASASDHHDNNAHNRGGTGGDGYDGPTSPSEYTHTNYFDVFGDGNDGADYSHANGRSKCNGVHLHSRACNYNYNTYKHEGGH